MILSCERGGPEPPPPPPPSTICSCALGRSCGPGSLGCVPAPRPPRRGRPRTLLPAARHEAGPASSLFLAAAPRPQRRAEALAAAAPSLRPRGGLRHPPPRGGCTLMPPSPHMVFISHTSCVLPLRSPPRGFSERGGRFRGSWKPSEPRGKGENPRSRSELPRRRGAPRGGWGRAWVSSPSSGAGRAK